MSSDFQVWPYLTVTVPVSHGVDLTTNAHVGLIDNASKPNQVLFRAVSYVSVDQRLSIGVGYTFVGVHDSSQAEFDEHRSSEEVLFRSTTDPRRPALTLRTRLEQRFRKDQAGMSLRSRVFTRVDLPILGSGWSLIGWNEFFYVVNGTGWAPGHRFDVMLNFVGVGIPVAKQTSFELGYVNSTGFRPRGPSQVDHVLGLFVTAKL